MTTADTADKAINSTYFVVPVLPDEGSSQTVLYFTGELSSGTWTPIQPNEINAQTTKHKTNCVTLTQPDPATILARTNPPVQVDPNVTLFAAVARTLNLSESLDILFKINSTGGVDIPVAPNTKRGVILIFTKAATAGGEPTQLIASPDPEIKNSIGGDTGGGR
jgi:hypothetical protein